MDKNTDIFCVNDLFTLLREYPNLEIMIEGWDEREGHIKSIRWEQGGISSWLVLSVKEVDEG